MHDEYMGSGGVGATPPSPGTEAETTTVVPPRRPSSFGQSSDALSGYAVLAAIRDRVRQDTFAQRWQAKDPQPGKAASGYSPAGERRWNDTTKKQEMVGEPWPLEDRHLSAHLMGQQPAGVYFVDKAGLVRAAGIDIDNKPNKRTGKLTRTWSDVWATATAIDRELRKIDVVPTWFRSRGGDGVNGWVFFNTPQRAAIVREVLGQAVQRAVGRNIKAGDIEVFPKQDSASSKGFGNLMALPFAGKSKMLDATGADIEVPANWVPPISAVLDVGGGDAHEPGQPSPLAGDRPPELAQIFAGLGVLPNGAAALYAGTQDGERREDWFSQLPPTRMLMAVATALDAFPITPEQDLDYEAWIKLLWACVRAEEAGAVGAIEACRGWSQPGPSYNRAAFDAFVAKEREKIAKGEDGVGVYHLFTEAEKRGAQLARFKTAQAPAGDMSAGAAGANTVPTDGEVPTHWGVPQGYRIEGGCWMCEVRNTDGDPVWVSIASVFAPVARKRDAQNLGWGLAVDIPDVDGVVHRVLLGADTYTGIRAEGFVRPLVGAGVTGMNVPRVRELLQSVQPARRLRVVSNPGWHDKAFVLPGGGVIAPDDVEEELHLDDDKIGPGNAGILGTRGDYDIWRHDVAAPMAHSAVGVMAMGFLLASPLLESAGEFGRAIHLYGPSSRGKSTASFAAASIYGDPNPVRKRMALSWNSTANGIESILAARSGVGVLLDEATMAEDPLILVRVAYAVGGAGGKSRMTMEGGLREAYEFNANIISNGEKSSREMIEAPRFGKTGQLAAGAELRLLNISAADGAHGVFDTLPDGANAGGLVVDITRAARAHYGHAGQAWLRLLVARRAAEPHFDDALRRRMQAVADELLHDHPGSHDQVRRGARGMALAAVAAEMATEAGILPWQPGTAIAAARIVLGRWVAARQGGEGETEQAQIVSQVRRYLMTHRHNHFLDLEQPSAGPEGEEGGDARREMKPPRPPIVVGYARRLTGAASTTVFFIPKGNLSHITPIDPKRVAKALEEAGFLLREAKRETRFHRITLPGAGAARTETIAVRGEILGDVEVGAPDGPAPPAAEVAEAAETAPRAAQAPGRGQGARGPQGAPGGVQAAPAARSPDGRMAASAERYMANMGASDRAAAQGTMWRAGFSPPKG